MAVLQFAERNLLDTSLLRQALEVAYWRQHTTLISTAFAVSVTPHLLGHEPAIAQLCTRPKLFTPTTLITITNVTLDSYAQFAKLVYQGCSFLVSGRVDKDGSYKTLDDVPIPPSLARGGLFEGIPESQFRIDISSTLLRQQGLAGVAGSAKVA